MRCSILTVKEIASVIAAIVILVVIVFSFFFGNIGARHYGGTMTIDLPPGQKLEVATWKESNLWYMTRPLKTGEQPETHTMKEQSNIGVLEGTIIFKESTN